MTGRQRPIVIAGLPRSGTTWTMRVLGSSPGARKIPEADKEDNTPQAIHAKHRLGRYPALRPGENDPAYHRLWEWILGGAYEDRRSHRARQIRTPGAEKRLFEGKRDLLAWTAGVIAMNPRPGWRPDGWEPPGRIVAKWIHLQLSLEWFASEFDTDILVLYRHPASVLASWLEVKLKDSRNRTLETRPDIKAAFVDPWGVPLPGDDPVERQCWRIGLLTAALEDAAGRHPNWLVRTHEDLCEDPPTKFKALFGQLDLEWSDGTDEYLRENDAPGTGYQTRRVAAELADSWQRRLDDDQLATLRRVLGWFPITRWTEADFERRPAGEPR